LSGVLYAHYGGAAFFRWQFSAGSHSRLPGLASLTSGIDLPMLFDPANAQRLE
jgi:hypothetical protein